MESQIDSSGSSNYDDKLTEEDSFSNSSDLELNNNTKNNNLTLIIPSDVVSTIAGYLNASNFEEIFKFLEKYCAFKVSLFILTVIERQEGHLL